MVALLLPAVTARRLVATVLLCLRVAVRRLLLHETATPIAPTVGAAIATVTTAGIQGGVADRRPFRARASRPARAHSTDCWRRVARRTPRSMAIKTASNRL